MWLDDEGVCKTVALPDPWSVMSDDFARSLRRELRGRRARRRLERLLDRHEDEIVEREDLVTVLRAEPGDATFAEAVPPAPLFDRPFRDLEELESLIVEVPLRWRLDGVLALQDAARERGRRPSGRR